VLAPPVVGGLTPPARCSKSNYIPQKMNISHFFIDRPIFACVISLVILLAGAVATPIEKQVNGVDKMLYISTSCTSDGSVKITVTFEVGTDPDMATVLVQNRVNVASAKLPEDCAII